MHNRLAITVGAAALVLAPVAWLAGDRGCAVGELSGLGSHDETGVEPAGGPLTHPAGFGRGVGQGAAWDQEAGNAGLLAALALAGQGLRDRRLLEASTSGHFADSDGDLLPDSLEWVLCTDPTTADTDVDGAGDFFESVHFSNALDLREVPVVDHGMRLVVTSEELAGGGSRVWIHLLFQFVGSVTPANVVQQFSPWVDMGMGRIPFNLLGASTPLVATAPGGNGLTMVRLSCDVGNLASMLSSLPLTVGADAVLGTKAVSAGAHVFGIDGQLFAMTPKLFYGKDDIFAVRPTQEPRTKPDPYRSSNKLCVMDIQAIGTSPLGVLYEVSDARCQTAHGFHCGPECAQMAGWTFSLPSGAPAITGG